MFAPDFISPKQRRCRGPLRQSVGKGTTPFATALAFTLSIRRKPGNSLGTMRPAQPVLSAVGPRSSGHPSSLCRVLSLQDAGGVPQRAPCSSQSRTALPLVNRLACQPPVPCLDTQNIIGNIRERQRDRGGQQQAGGTQRPRSYLQAFPARVECVLVNPTSEEYKYLCCRNPSDEVLELAFSIHCSLSEVCLVLSPTDMTAAAPGAQQSPH